MTPLPLRSAAVNGFFSDAGTKAAYPPGLAPKTSTGIPLGDVGWSTMAPAAFFERVSQAVPPTTVTTWSTSDSCTRWSRNPSGRPPVVHTTVAGGIESADVLGVPVGDGD